MKNKLKLLTYTGVLVLAPVFKSKTIHMSALVFFFHNSKKSLYRYTGSLRSAVLAPFGIVKKEMALFKNKNDISVTKRDSDKRFSQFIEQVSG